MGCELICKRVNLFWNNVLLACRCFKNKVKIDAADKFLAEPPFYNANIKIDCKLFIYKDRQKTYLALEIYLTKKTDSIHMNVLNNSTS